MAYKVLYRKYRPDSFGKIIGQDDIVSILKNSIAKDKISHAYLFTGPRGTGKTSTAKVFAKTVNCKENNLGEACGNCNSCLMENNPDIIEIDAASNNGVEEIRELRNNIDLLPTSSRYKVYIIDEVHMLTTGAFNALLKTLEEPPEHVIFILATTEVYKIPITILSRCQRFDFSKVEKDIMIPYLAEICSKENINVQKEALTQIYYLSDGCLRDALSILDQISKENNTIDEDYIMKHYSIISRKNVEDILNNILSGNVLKVLEIIGKFENTGMNAQKFIANVIRCLEEIAIEIKSGIKSKYNFVTINNLIKKLNEHYINARINENAFTMIRLSFLEEIDSYSNNKDIEKNNTLNKENTSFEKQEKSKLSSIDIRINNCFVGANKKNLNDFQTIWNDLNCELIPGVLSTEFKPVIASDVYSVLEVSDETIAELFNSKYLLDENKIQNIDKKLVAISTERWQEEKEKYKNNIKNNIEYKLIEEKEYKEQKMSKLEKEVNSLFDKEIVEII